MNTFIKYALIRALKTFCQALVSELPVGTAITPVMIQALDWSVIYVVLAWVGTALLAGFISITTSIATGLPEVELEHSLYMNREEPEDSEVSEYDDE